MLFQIRFGPKHYCVINKPKFIYYLLKSITMNKKQKTFRLSLRVCMTGILMFLIASVYAQDISVGGSVKDANGEPVIGATINVEGSQRRCRNCDKC